MPETGGRTLERLSQLGSGICRSLRGDDLALKNASWLNRKLERHWFREAQRWNAELYITATSLRPYRLDEHGWLGREQTPPLRPAFYE